MLTESPRLARGSPCAGRLLEETTTSRFGICAMKYYMFYFEYYIYHAILKVRALIRSFIASTGETVAGSCTCASTASKAQDSFLIHRPSSQQLHSCPVVRMTQPLGPPCSEFLTSPTAQNTYPAWVDMPTHLQVKTGQGCIRYFGPD